MAVVSVEAIKELRHRTGVGMGKCKEALLETQGDMEEAIAYLRRIGAASAVKKEGRETNEGLVGCAEGSAGFSLVEVNAETDFVAKNDIFGAFLSEVSKAAADTGTEDVAALAEQTGSSGQTIEERRTDVIQKIGENIQLRRAIVLPKAANQSVGIYSHMGGKICTAVVIEGSEDEAELARGIAMHVAAAAPDFLNESEVPADVIENEKEIARAQVEGKPENVVEKILTGKIQAYYKQACLVNQPYIRDEKSTVEEFVSARGKETGKDLKVVRFVRWMVGG